MTYSVFSGGMILSWPCPHDALPQAFCSDGSFLRCFGSEGTRPGQFRRPHAVSECRGYLVVSEFTGKRVQVYTTAGKQVQVASAGNVHADDADCDFTFPRDEGRYGLDMLLGGQHVVYPPATTALSHGWHTAVISPCLSVITTAVNMPCIHRLHSSAVFLG